MPTDRKYDCEVVESVPEIKDSPLPNVEKVVSTKYRCGDVELRLKNFPNTVDLKVASWNPLQLERKQIPSIIAVLQKYLEEVD